MLSHVADSVRQFDKDRFLAGLFLPEDVREDIYAIYAFNQEIARVGETVSEPMVGEIRFQWWRDVLDGERAGEADAHPIAKPLMQAIDRHALPRAAFQNLIEARVFDLYHDPMPTLNDLEGYCGETSSVLLQLAATVLNGGIDPGRADAAGHGGVAYALTGLLRAMPYHAAQGRVYLPRDLAVAHGIDIADLAAGRDSAAVRSLVKSVAEIAGDHLERAEAHLKDVPENLFPAFLPLALVRPWLKQVSKAGNPFEPLPEIPQWRRQWTLYRAARRQRL